MMVCICILILHVCVNVDVNKCTAEVEVPTVPENPTSLPLSEESVVNGTSSPSGSTADEVEVKGKRPFSTQITF